MSINQTVPELRGWTSSGSNGSSGGAPRIPLKSLPAGGRVSTPLAPVDHRILEPVTVPYSRATPLDLPQGRESRELRELRTVGSRVRWLFNNDRPESAPGLIWLAWAVVVLVYSPFASGDTLRYPLVGLAIFACWSYIAIHKKARGVFLWGPIGMVFGCGWTAWGLAGGLGFWFVVAWFLILAALYAPIWSMLMRAKYDPAQAVAAMAGGVEQMFRPEFEDVPLLRGAERVTPVETTYTGTTFDLRLPRGKDPVEIAAKENQLATAFGYGLGEVEALTNRKDASLLTINRHILDMHDEPQPWPLADAPRILFNEPVPFGVYRDGQVAHLEYLHMFFGGASNSGKTYAMFIPLLAAAYDPGVQLVLLDGKETELGGLEHACMPSGYVGQDVGQANELLEWAEGQIFSNMRLLKENGYRRAKDAPRELLPLTVIGCDELRQYTTVASKKQRDTFERLYGRLLSLGRSAGITLLAGTQYPSQQTLAPEVMAGFDTMFCLRTNNEVQTRIILGQETKVRASEIPNTPEHYGKGYLSTGGNLPRLIRTFHVDDDTFARMAAGAPPSPIAGAVRTVEAVPSIGPRFPSGDRINDPRQATIWNALDQPRTVAELAGIPGTMTEKPIRALLTDWTARGWLTAGKDGNAQTWRREDNAA